MDREDPGAEWLRLSEYYRKMTDGELLNLARQSSSLTNIAQQVLADQMSFRALKLPPEEPRTPPVPEPDPNSPYAQDRELVEICRVWSLSDALQLQRLLDLAGIPFHMGTAPEPGSVLATLNFAEGVPVRVMRIGVPWAWEALRNYEPADEPREEQVDWHEVPVICPKCRSTDIVFERLTSKPRTRAEWESAKFEWTCESCGHHWIDEGILKER